LQHNDHLCILPLQIPLELLYDNHTSLRVATPAEGNFEATGRRSDWSENRTIQSSAPTFLPSLD
jgi:hypothetical protein